MLTIRSPGTFNWSEKKQSLKKDIKTSVEIGDLDPLKSLATFFCTKYIPADLSVMPFNLACIQINGYLKKSTIVTTALRALGFYFKNKGLEYTLGGIKEWLCNGSFIHIEKESQLYNLGDNHFFRIRGVSIKGLITTAKFFQLIGLITLEEFENIEYNLQSINDYEM